MCSAVEWLCVEEETDGELHPPFISRNGSRNKADIFVMDFILTPSVVFSIIHTGNR